MLDSLTIFSKGGVILFQHKANDSTTDQLNDWISDCLLNPTFSGGKRTTRSGFCYEWQEDSDKVVVALVPSILNSPISTYQPLLQATLDEYNLFQKHTDDSSSADLFQSTFQALLRTHKPTETTETASNTTTKVKTTKPGKQKRTWHDGNAKVTKEAMAQLDCSKDTVSPEDSHERALAEARAAYLPSDEEEEGDEELEPPSSSWTPSFLSTWVDMATGTKLTQEHLEQPLQELQRLLTSKNVANDIAQDICQSIQQKLLGKRLASFTRVQTALRQALEHKIHQILTNQSIDLLRDVLAKRRKPYSIVVVGINGVGKSTTIAKLAYYFQNHNCSPLLAACDTFRSGAVEQLQVHADCLGVPIFHQGYAKDPSAVAKAAIQHGTQNKHDVVLIDTAGRMQNNVPLMKALQKLVQENQPDLVLFVGEALVGHDGIDQVRVFQRATHVHGIILTKFDTVSDKVGAALTMTHVTGSPIVFVGTGQKYNHLKKLNTPAVLKSLFS